MNSIQLSKSIIVHRKTDKGQRKFISALILTQKDFFNPIWKEFFLFFLSLRKLNLQRPKQNIPLFLQSAYKSILGNSTVSAVVACFGQH